MLSNDSESLSIGVENLPFDRDEDLAQIEIATLVIIFVVTVLGNGTVLLALWTKKRHAGRKKLSRMYFFILHLSLADLITAIFGVLPQLAWDITFRFQGGLILCKVVKFGQTLGPYLSSYILMATAIDRHQAICYPLTYCSWTSRRSKAMVIIAWISSLLFCVPQVVIFSIREAVSGIPETADCWAEFSKTWGEQVYVTWYGISVFIMPLAVLVVTYSSICREIWHSSMMDFGPKMRKDRLQSPLISRAKINTVRQTIAVIVMHILCSSPFICAQLWAVWDSESSSNPFFNGSVFTILALLYSLNSCINPWIYLAFNRELPILLIKHYLTAHKSYQRSSGSGHSPTNSVETTSLRPFSRWSFKSNSRASVSGPKTSIKHNLTPININQ